MKKIYFSVFIILIMNCCTPLEQKPIYFIHILPSSFKEGLVFYVDDPNSSKTTIRNDSVFIVYNVENIALVSQTVDIYYTKRGKNNKVDRFLHPQRFIKENGEAIVFNYNNLISSVICNDERNQYPLDRFAYVFCVGSCNFECEQKTKTQLFDSLVCRKLNLARH
jgi:hypothetical protein